MKTVRKFLNIPDRIIVGYGKNNNKEGFVTYYRGPKIAKESTWNSWRSKKIEPVEFENKPTTGFIIDTESLVYSGIGWTSRQCMYVAVQDPRGFTIHIHPYNLLGIIQNGQINSGGYVEGEFVYVWDGPDIELLSIKSEDYIATKKTSIATKEANLSSWSSFIPGVKYAVGWKDADKGEGLYYLGDFKLKCVEGWGPYEKVIQVKSHLFCETISPNCRIEQKGRVNEFLYPLDSKYNLSKKELDDITMRINELPCSKIKNDIEEFVITDSKTSQEKLNRIAVDKIFNNGLSANLNKISVCKTDGKTMDRCTIDIDINKNIYLRSNARYTITDKGTIYTSTTALSKLLNEKEIKNIIDNFKPIEENNSNIFIKIGDSLYNGIDTPFPQKLGDFRLP